MSKAEINNVAPPSPLDRELALVISKHSLDTKSLCDLVAEPLSEEEFTREISDCGVIGGYIIADIEAIFDSGMRPLEYFVSQFIGKNPHGESMYKIVWARDTLLMVYVSVSCGGTR